VTFYIMPLSVTFFQIVVRRFRCETLWRGGLVFHLTLREGMRCLAAHRCKVDLLDALFCINIEQRFLFGGTVQNRREALRFGPAGCMIFWVAVMGVTIFYVRPHQSGFETQALEMLPKVTHTSSIS
jgi:hypothetical protein